MSRLGAIALFASAVVAVAASVGSWAATDAYHWRLPSWVKPPPVPPDNPMNASKVELGRRLFYDIRLSGPGYMACATCHVQKNGFAERRRVSLGITGQRHRRNAPGLANVGYFSTLTWANHRERRLEKQLQRPLFGTDPVEMGAKGHEAAILRHIADNSVYRALFASAFPSEPGRIDFALVAKAIAAFQRTLISRSAPYDLYKYANQPDAISAAAKRGEALFFGDRLKCGRCHIPPLFGGPGDLAGFHNTGLYNVDGKGGQPPADKGLAEQTGKSGDLGKFRTPSLRNVSVTGPYMHDGSMDDLDAVIDHYAAGGRAARQGLASPLRSPLVAGFSLTGTERSDLLAFLESLTDRDFLDNPRLATPFR